MDEKGNIENAIKLLQQKKKIYNAGDKQFAATNIHLSNPRKSVTD